MASQRWNLRGARFLLFATGACFRPPDGGFLLYGAMARTVSPPCRLPLDQVHLDDIRGARDVHRRARGDDDAVAGLEQPRLACGLERSRPDLLDVAALGDPDRRHAPLQRHLLQRPLEEIWSRSLQAARETGLLEAGDRVVITAGTAVNIPGSTNVIKVDLV